MNPLALLLGIIFCVVVAVIGFGVLSFFLPENRQARKIGRQDAQELALTRRQLDIAIDSLIKIAAEDAGNPALEAKIALGDISRKEITR